MLTNSPEETFEPVSSALRRTWQFGKQQAPHAIFTAADGGCWRLAALFAFGAICAVALAARASDSVWEAASFGKVAAFPEAVPCSSGSGRARIPASSGPFFSEHARRVGGGDLRSRT